MKLSDYAKKYNITYQTAWNNWKRGLIPNAEQLPTGTEIHVVNREQKKDNELMADMATIITSFVARLYGRRRSRKRTQEIVEKICNE
jgi:predicted site-specific integrase-resolvase